MNSGVLACEGVHWMVSDSLNRIILWLVTLFSPSHVVLSLYSGIGIHAPVWMFDNTTSYTAFVFLGFINAETWTPLDGIIILAAMAILKSPILLATIMLEMVPRGIGSLAYSRGAIFVYPALVLIFEGLIYTMKMPLLVMPFPLTALVQYLRYEHLCDADYESPSVPAPAAIDTTAVV